MVTELENARRRSRSGDQPAQLCTAELCTVNGVDNLRSRSSRALMNWISGHVVESILGLSDQWILAERSYHG